MIWSGLIISKTKLKIHRRIYIYRARIFSYQIRLYWFSFDISLFTAKWNKTRWSSSKCADSIFFVRVYIYSLVFPLQDRLIGQMDRVFANGPGDLGSIPCRAIPKTFKMVLDTALLNTQQYKVHIKGKVEQSKERRSALTYTSVY